MPDEAPTSITVSGVKPRALQPPERPHHVDLVGNDGIADRLRDIIAKLAALQGEDILESRVWQLAAGLRRLVRNARPPKTGTLG